MLLILSQILIQQMQGAHGKPMRVIEEMVEDYENKYKQLKVVCKKQEGMIGKLQEEIRERCQSYLLEISKYKQTESTIKLQGKSEQGNGSSSRLQNKDLRSNFDLNPNHLPKQNSIHSRQDQNNASFISQRSSKAKPAMMWISQQIEINEYLQVIDKQSQQKQSAKIADLLQSFKARISVLQTQKNKFVKQLQKVNTQQKIIESKLVGAERQNVVLVKSEKKLKERIKRMPDYQPRIQQIYKAIKDLSDQVQQKQLQVIGQEQTEKQFISKLQYIMLFISNLSRKQNKEAQESAHQTVIQEKVVQNNNRLSILHQEPSPSIQLQSASTQTQNIEHQQVNPVAHQFSSASKINNIQLNNNTQLNNSNTIIRQLQTNQKEKLESSQVKPFNYTQSHLVTSIIEHQQCQDEKIGELLLKNQNLQGEIHKLSIYNSNLTKQIEEMKMSKLSMGSQIKQSHMTNGFIDQSNLNSTKNDLQNSKFTIAQTLQAPYFVEEELALDTNNQYVKRNFIRKKIVKRNLSATTYRVVSKSKEEVDSIVKNKLSQYRQKSKQKAERLRQKMANSRELKLQSIRKQIVENRVSEVSQPRDSDIHNTGEQVTIFEVVTTTGNSELKTAKIYSNNRQQSFHSLRKF